MDETFNIDGKSYYEVRQQILTALLDHASTWEYRHNTFGGRVVSVDDAASIFAGLITPPSQKKG